jgi:hypothetical protein
MPFAVIDKISTKGFIIQLVLLTEISGLEPVKARSIHRTDRKKARSIHRTDRKKGEYVFLLFIECVLLQQRDQRCISAVLVPLFRQTVADGGASSSNKLLVLESSVPVSAEEAPVQLFC